MREQADSDRSQNAIGPNHLRPTARGTIHLRLKSETALIDDAHAAKARAFRQGERDLSTNNEYKEQDEFHYSRGWWLQRTLRESPNADRFSETVKCVQCFN